MRTPNPAYDRLVQTFVILTFLVVTILGLTTLSKLSRLGIASPISGSHSGEVVR